MAGENVNIGAGGAASAPHFKGDGVVPFRCGAIGADDERIDIFACTGSPEGVVGVPADAVGGYCVAVIEGVTTFWRFAGTLGTATGWVRDDAVLDQLIRARSVINPLASAAGVLAVDLSAGLDHRGVLTESIDTLSVTNGPASGFGQSARLMFVQGAGGFTLPAVWGGVDWWLPGSAPTMPAVAGKRLLAVLWHTGDELVADYKVQP